MRRALVISGAIALVFGAFAPTVFAKPIPLTHTDASAAKAESPRLDGASIMSCEAGEMADARCAAASFDSRARRSKSGGAPFVPFGAASFVPEPFRDIGRCRDRRPETCDGVDNDCDGRIDEHIRPRVIRCGQGRCGAKGEARCVKGEIVETCEPGPPRREVCNGRDDDCDGETDESIAETPIACGEGRCARAGARRCVDGRMADDCQPGAPDAEVCNDLDDDCDGEVDEVAQVYRITNWDGGRYGLMAWDFNFAGIYRWNMDEVFFTVGPDGSARMTGQVSVSIIESGPGDLGEVWELDMRFVYRGQGDAFGGPNIEDEDFQTAEITDAWRYWDMVEGTMTRPGSVVELEQRPRSGNYPFQLGISANGKDRELGVALWFYYTRTDATGRRFSSRGDLVAGAELVERGCGPLPELCNGEDDDLDGAIDEGFGVGEACTIGEGACAADGEVMCGPNGGARCDAEPGQPGPELCNAVDDDCDGSTDEDIDPVPTACGVGACAADGESSCVDGQMVDDCAPGAPADELCNEVDDDCDGAVDEGSRSHRVSAYAANGHGLVANAFGRNGGGVNMHFRDDAVLTVNDDGTGRLTGTAFVYAGNAPRGEEWAVDLELAYRGRGPDFGGPKIEQPALQPPEVQALWDYYDMTTGTLTRPGSRVLLAQRPGDGRYPLQMGWAANNKDADFGASVWFRFQRFDDDGFESYGVGDFNLDLDPIGEAGCFEEPEVCDGEDDDRDGAVDEGFALGEACRVGVGACAADGLTVCGPDGDVLCGAEPLPGLPEICDGADNDCDGATDEAVDPIPTSCGVGACGADGQLTCVNGAMVDDCAPGEPTDESCDETDEDCDGEVDEGVSSREWRVRHFAGGHALWLPGFERDGHTVIMRYRDDATFFWHVDGTASVIGTAYVHALGGGPGQIGQEWFAEFYLRYRGEGDAFGGPKIERAAVQTPDVTDDWHYWEIIGARLVRPEETVELTQRPVDGRFPFQFGWLANGKTDTVGAAVWFDWHREAADGAMRSGHGDLNVEVSDEVALCAEPPIDPVCENTCRDEGDRHMQDCLNMGFPAEDCEALLWDWLDQCIMLQCC